jgi:acyl carrier protein
MEREGIQKKIKEIILQHVDLGGKTVDDIRTEAPLFDGKDGGLGLDSVEALELILGIEQGFGVSVGEGPEVRNYFYSVATLAGYVEALQKGIPA